MNTKKLLAAVAIPATFALGALGFAGQQAIAQSNPATGPQTTQSAQPAQAQTGVAEKTGGADTDNIQQGDQIGPDKGADKADAPEKGAEKAGGPDKDNLQQGPGPNVQQGSQSGPETPDTTTGR